MLIADTDKGMVINLNGQADCALMKEALERALNTWDGAPADIILIYDRLKNAKVSDYGQ